MHHLNFFKKKIYVHVPMCVACTENLKEQS